MENTKSTNLKSNGRDLIIRFAEAVGKVRSASYMTLGKIEEAEFGGKAWSDWYSTAVEAILDDNPGELEIAVSSMENMYSKCVE